jgi:transcriptional regulator with XRE-family HTH domain
MQLVGDKLRKAREDKILSHRELALRAELSPTTVLKLENAEVSTPHPRTIRKLAAALEIDARELLEGWAMSVYGTSTVNRPRRTKAEIEALDEALYFIVAAIRPATIRQDDAYARWHVLGTILAKLPRIPLPRSLVNKAKERAKPGAVK